MEEIRYSPRRAGKSIHAAIKFLSVIREGSESVVYIGKDVVAVPTKKYQQLEAENKELKEWILVSERLPENGEEIDVWLYNHRETDVSFDKNCFKRYVEDHQGDFSHYEEMKGVTHWKPLPEPPKETN